MSKLQVKDNGYATLHVPKHLYKALRLTTESRLNLCVHTNAQGHELLFITELYKEMKEIDNS